MCLRTFQADERDAGHRRPVLLVDGGASLTGWVTGSWSCRSQGLIRDSYNTQSLQAERHLDGNDGYHFIYCSPNEAKVPTHFPPVRYSTPNPAFTRCPLPQVHPVLEVHWNIAWILGDGISITPGVTNRENEFLRCGFLNTLHPPRVN